MLQRLVVRNFRSLEKFELDADPLTALVGPNGAGKSSILRAIDLVLGSRYPGLSSFSIPHDFTRFDDAKDLVIRVRFDSPYVFRDRINKDHGLHGLELRLAPYKIRTKRGEPGDLHCTFHPLGEDRKPPVVALEAGKRGPRFGPLTSVPSELRTNTSAIFIDHRRSVTQHQPWARGSVLARLLGSVRRELDDIEIADGVTHAAAYSERYQFAMDALRTPKVIEIEDAISVAARRMLGFLGSSMLADLDLRFGFADPANPFGTLRLNYLERGLELPAERLGSGVQSAIVVGIFEAFRQLGTSAGILLIEEPEMYLHPQAQRYFYRLIVDLVESGQSQVIYSTHSPIFADASRFEGLRMVRRQPGAMSTLAAVTRDADITFLAQQRASRKLLALTSARSEVFFAHRALLVEGVGDAMAVRMLADVLGMDLDAEDLAVVDCGSKSAIPFLARVCRALEIPVIAVHDSDIYDVEDDAEKTSKTCAQNREAEGINRLIEDAIGDPTCVFVIEPSLEGALSIPPDAREKPRRIAEGLASFLPDDYPTPLRQALNKLLE